MTGLVIFVLLLVGRLVHGATEDIRVSVNSRISLTANPKGYPLQCVLETNQDEVLNYEPGNDRIRTDIEGIDYSKKKTCSVRIFRINPTHAGVWKLTAYTVQRIDFDNNHTTAETFVFNLYVEQEKRAIPTNYISVYDGHFISMKHRDNYENLTACNLIGPVVNDIDLLMEKRDDFQLLGQCGIHMKVNTTYNGLWRLNAVVNEFIVYRVSFDIRVHDLEEEDTDNMLVLHWIRGYEEIIDLSIQPKICQIINPRGAIVATSYGECYYKVKVATILHEGIWIARYNMHGMLEPIDKKFRIETNDRVNFNSSVIYNEDGSTRLLCRLESRNQRQPSLCSFIRPDGITLYMTPTISTERYTSNVNFDSTGNVYNIMECEITIQKLENIDYGAWRCNLKNSANALYGSVLHVDYPDSRDRRNNNSKQIAVKVKADDVHVKHGDSFTVKCLADSELKYCWLRSPNGTVYSVAQNVDVILPSVLRYEGNGLSFGECGARISAATNSDDGKWNCYMGVADGGEEIVTATVTVTESYLMAEQSEITVSTTNNPVLSCHILPRMLDRAVHYCRWIRPDGYGIYNDISHRYTTSGNYSQCRLVILNYRPEEDNGYWTCVAGLRGQKDELKEAFAHVRLLRSGTVQSGALIGIITGTSLLLVVTLAIIAYIAIRNRCQVLPKNPPAYSPQDYYPPKSLQPKFDIKEYRY